MVMIGTLFIFTASRPGPTFCYMHVCPGYRLGRTKSTYAIKKDLSIWRCDHVVLVKIHAIVRSGSMQLLGDRLVSWSSKRQKSVATFSDGDDDDEDDDVNKDLDAHDDDDDDDAIESDDDGDNITHPKLSTFSTDDQEEQDDKEEQEDDDEDEEDISDQLVCTPSNYQTSDESEKHKDDDRVKNGEEDKEGDVTNVALEGGDVDMTEADTNEDTEDAHVTLRCDSACQYSKVHLCQTGFKFILSTTDEPIRLQLTTTHNPSTAFAGHSLKLTTPSYHPPQQLTLHNTAPIPNFASLFDFNQRVTALESNLSKLKQSNPFAEAISSIPGIVNEYLGSKMNKVVDVAIKLKSNKLREEAQAENQAFLNSLDSNMQKIIKDQVKTQTSKIKSKVEKYVAESLGAEVLIRSTNQPQTSYGIASSLSEFELKRILMDKMEENKSIDRSDVQKNLYNALLSGKEAESSKEPTRKESRTTSSSKGASRSQPTDLNETTHLEFITGDDDVIPTREVQDEPQQAEDQTLRAISFDEFMATPINFSAFMINRLKIDHLTQELLTGPTYDLIKGMPYPHNLIKPLPLIPNARGRLVIPFDHFINNDLEYLKGGRSSRKYTTSITKTKATDYGQVNWIEDRIPRTTWSVNVWRSSIGLSKADQKKAQPYKGPDTTRLFLKKLTPHGYPDVQALSIRRIEQKRFNAHYGLFDARAMESQDKRRDREHAEFDESDTYVLERFYTSAGNPVKEILLKLNLPDIYSK
ncbi:hypothetical protein Tco_1545891 [Tanacetum coccineum]